ncbi:MAG: hypothetical protein MUC87_01430 [Bacteroidia bacterium]|jgi:hypothetical protein|nr:hypothetical protein [Bacteroidia bacterium]
MKSIRLFHLLLLLLCSFPLYTQTVLSYRTKADSCAKAGNLRAADSLYTLALTSQPNAQDYLSRAALRRKKGEPCRACGDLFSASVLGDKNAVKQFRRDCYRANKKTDCPVDSFSMYYTPGKVEVRQKVNNGWVLLYNTDTAFKNINTCYLSGKDTLRLAFDTCVMPDSVQNKIRNWVSVNYRRPMPVITMPVLAYVTSSVVYALNSCTYQIAFDPSGTVIDARVITGHPSDPNYDVQIIRALRILPPTGQWGCESGVRVVTMQIRI